jgi:ribosomal protein L32
MRKYGLKPKQLKKVYNTLISRGALSEYEFHCRWGKAPELEEATASLTDSSTGVSLVESFSEETLRLFRSGRSAPQTEEPPRHMPSRPSSQPPSRSKRRSNADEDAMERCPNCGRAKTSHSHDSCLYCGIVFSKMSHSEKYRGVAIWDRDTR